MPLVCRARCPFVFLALLTVILLLPVPGASAATLSVCASGCAFSDLQQAIDAAQPGDTIALRAGETFVGHYVLTPKSNPDGKYIVIRSDAPDGAFPPSGTRLVPPGVPGANVSASSLARVKGRGGQWKTTPVFEAIEGSHHYRLQFLDIDGVAQEGWSTLVELGTLGATQTTLSSVPYAVTLDRVYVHGHPVKGQKRCVALNGRDMDVLDSYISGCASFSSDAQAIGGFNGPGPYRIINNYLEGSGENVMFGGADPTIDGLIPSDIEIRRNHFSKPQSWKDPILRPPSSAPSATVLAGAGSLAAGTHYFTVVALLDAQGEVAVSAQSAERSTSVSGSGAAMKLTWNGVSGADRYRIYRGTASRGQNRYLETSSNATSFTYTGASEASGTPPSDGTRWTVKNLLELKSAQRVVIDGNLFENIWHANQKGYAVQFTVRNQDGGAPWTVIRDVTFTNNIIRNATAGINILGSDDLQTSQLTERITIRNNLVYDVESEFLLLTRGPRDVKVSHNTVFHGGKIILVDDGQCLGFEFTNNTAPHNEYGIFGSGASYGNSAIAAYFPNGVFRRNAIGGAPASIYPPDNFYPDMDTFLAQFVNASADDYRLTSSSSFRGAGTDGKDLGVDFAALDGAQSGGPGPVPPPTGGSPYGGTPVSLPGTIQAENFDEGTDGAAYHDTSSGNYGGKYRSTNVDIESTSDSGGGYNIGWMAPGEWLNYTVDVTTAGTYDLEVRVASSGSGGTFHIEVGGANKTGPLVIANTGGWQNWVTVKKTGVSLAAGPQTWRVVVDAAGPGGIVGNLNSIKVVAASSPPPTGTTPYGGTPVALPGTIQAENFDEGAAGSAYHDTTSGNYGGKYRSTNVDVESTGDSGGGYNVGWMAVGEWLNFTAKVGASGTYDVEFRLASNGGGGRLHLEVNGADKTGLVSIPDTGGWQSWVTVKKTGVSLGSGDQVLRLVIDAAGASGSTANVNYIRIASSGSAPPPPTSGGDIVLHASDVTRMAGNWARVSSSSGAGGQAMQSIDRGWSSTDAPRVSPTDYFEAQFTPEANRPYRLWLRLRAASDSKWNESVWVQFSGASGASGTPRWPIGSASALLVNLEDCSGCGVSGWGWQDHAYWLSDEAVVQFASAAQQTIRIQTREDGVSIDQIVLSPVTYFETAPGRSTNDTTILSKTSPSTPAPTGGDIVLYAVDASRLSGNWVRMSSSTGAGGQSLQSADRGWSAADAPLASPADYFEMPFTPEAGRAYRLWIRMRGANDSRWNESVWVQFSGAVDAGGNALWRQGTTSALLVNLEDCSSCGISRWGWQDNAWWVGDSSVVRFASATSQTIRVQTREDGVEIDQVVLSPVTYFESAPGAPANDTVIVPK
jgi:hypothetical protein